MKTINLLVAGLLMSSAVQFAKADAGSPTLYDQLGGKPAITKVVDGMLAHVGADKRINHFFANANIPHLKMMLIEQICAGSGGPCTYTGRSMPDAHKGMNIRSDDFNALVEDLQMSLADNNVPTSQGNQLLAILAPLKKDVDHK